MKLILLLLLFIFIVSCVCSFKLKSSTLCNNRNVLSMNNYNDIKKGIAIFTSSILLSSNIVLARPEGVNRPDLLPSGEKTTLIGYN